MSIQTSFGIGNFFQDLQYKFSKKPKEEINIQEALMIGDLGVIKFTPDAFKFDWDDIPPEALYF